MLTEDREWRCFFCDEVFTTRESAFEHFGSEDVCYPEAPACKLNEQEGGLLKLYRDALAEIRNHQLEETPLYRALYQHGFDDAHAVMRAEEKGYERGLRDGRMYFRWWRRLGRWAPWPFGNGQGWFEESRT